MREILFRGKTMNGDWVFGNLTILKKKYNHIESGYYISNSIGLPFAFHVRPETVGQFTGLEDNNGKRIWEGDIVKIGEDWLFKNEEISVIEYHQHGIPYIVQRYLKNKPGYGDYNFDYLKDNHDGFYHYYEVIGNVFDNPELLVNHNTTQP